MHPDVLLSPALQTPAARPLRAQLGALAAALALGGCASPLPPADRAAPAPAPAPPVYEPVSTPVTGPAPAAPPPSSPAESPDDAAGFAAWRSAFSAQALQ